MRPRLLVLAPLLLAAGGVSATAFAVPPGGPVENPLGASASLVATTVPFNGTVTVSASGYDPAERVSLKVDDGAAKDAARNDVLQTADAGADGTFTATVDLSRVAPALGDGAHAVRLLSAAAAGARSIHVDFTTTGAPAAPSPTPTAPGTTPAPGPGTPATPTTPTGAPVSAVPPSIASTALRASGGRVALRLRGGGAGLRGTASLRTRTGVTLARAIKVSVNARATKAYRFTLTSAGRAQVRRHARLAVVVRVAPSGSRAFSKAYTLRRVA